MRAWVVVSAAFVALGFGVFLYKIFGLQYPLRAGDQPGTWRVELAIRAMGEGGFATLEIPLPRSTDTQQLASEEVRSGPMRFGISDEHGNRYGQWTGKVRGLVALSYQASLTTAVHQAPLPAREVGAEYPKSVAAFLEDSPGIATQDPTIKKLSAELLVLGARDKAKLAREVYRFVSREIDGSLSSEPMDAVTVVQEGRGNPLGRARLFCALARVNGLPCRVVMGLTLAGHNPEQLRYWNEAHVGGRWVPFDVVERRLERLPPDRIVLSTRDDAPVRASGLSAVTYRAFVQSESQAYEDLLRRRMVESDHVLDRYSILSLPVQVQRHLRLLVLVPLGALVMTLLRSVVGIRTFGTFMPMLIALAMTATGLAVGSAVFVLLIGLALLSRLLIRPFYLLLVARVAFTLTLVILLMIILIIAGDRLDFALGGVTAFPFVIMTMIVERINVSLDEEGVGNTLRRLGATVLSIYITYAVIHAEALQTLFVVFPELLLVILGVLIAIGRYTGYRLTELLRFRAFAAAASYGGVAGLPGDPAGGKDR